jgi:hypothetical protein
VPDGDRPTGPDASGAGDAEGDEADGGPDAWLPSSDDEQAATDIVIAGASTARTRAETVLIRPA